MKNKHGGHEEKGQEVMVMGEFDTQLDCVGSSVNTTWVEGDIIMSVRIALVKELHHQKTVFDGSSIRVSGSTGNCRIFSQVMSKSSRLGMFPFKIRYLMLGNDTMADTSFPKLQSQ